MNKSEFVSAIAKKANLTQAQAKVALEAAIETTKETLGKGESIALIGFGTMSVGVRPERVGRNPRTGEKTIIAEKKVVKFKAGSELKF